MPFSFYLFLRISVRTLKRRSKTPNYKCSCPNPTVLHKSPCPPQIPVSSGSSRFAFWYPFHTGNCHKFCRVSVETSKHSLQHRALQDPSRQLLLYSHFSSTPLINHLYFQLLFGIGIQTFTWYFWSVNSCLPIPGEHLAKVLENNLKHLVLCFQGCSSFLWMRQRSPFGALMWR